MAEQLSNGHQWMVAAWPGMGQVGAGAVAHLLGQPGIEPLAELDGEDFFDIEHVVVDHGIARAATRPRSLLFNWKTAAAGRDVLVFLGEAQPPARGLAMCRRIVDEALGRGVERIVTFAAMASQLHPSAEPRVFAAATDATMLPHLRRLNLTLLDGGHISGLNGLLLAAAAEKSIPAVCLLGELPFFAAGMRNPKASAAVLDAFARLVGVPVEILSLQEQGRQVEAAMLDLLRRFAGEDAAEPEAGGEPDKASDAEPGDGETGVEDADGGGGSSGGHGDGGAVEGLGSPDRERIELMFDEAASDRRAAMRLKHELDRMGVFPEYEDRFLDLFRQAD